MVAPAESTHIAIDGVNLFFGDNHILKSVTVGMPRHTVTAIIGPSGCGKSTLLRCLNRMNDFIPRTRIEGRIALDGTDIYAPRVDTSDLRMRVGMVFQKPNPFPKSIFENVAFGLKIRGWRNHGRIMERVEQSLRSSWLWDEVKDRLSASAFSLSGGQQQRLCIARALATTPEVLLLDEPTSALDPQATRKIEELVVELRNAVSIVIVTHNISQAGRIADNTAFMYLGEMLEYGPTEKLFTVPQHPRTEAYLTGKFG